jgi:hypothetical protein
LVIREACRMMQKGEIRKQPAMIIMISGFLGMLLSL